MTAIIGGGIGGLTLALALHHFGRTAPVYEASPEPGEVGAGIWVSPNAMQVFERLNLASAIMASGYELGAIELLDYDESRLQFMDLAPFKQKYGHGIIAIKRAELLAILSRAYEERTGQAIAYGHKCNKIMAQARSATAVFDNGVSVESDCLIGADGIRSAVRRHLIPSVHPEYTGQTSWRRIVHGELPEKWRRTSVEIWGKGRRFGFSYIGEGQVYWYATCDRPAMLLSHSSDAEPVDLLQIFSEFPDYVRNLINDNAGAAIRTDIYDLPVLTKWYEGSIALLGDAAHATSPNMGQGGAQAVEDGYVLAEALTACDSLSAAFARYQNNRHDKARTIVRKSRVFGRLAHLKSGPGRAFRNAFIKLAPASVSMREWDEVYRLNF